MRVDVAKTAEIAQAARVTAGVLIGVVVLCVFGTVVGISGALITVSQRGTHSLALLVPATLCVVVAGVLLPGVGGVVSLVFMARAFRRAAGLEALVALASAGPLDRATFEARLGRARAEAVIGEAIAAGALALDDARGVSRPSPTQIASSTPSPIEPYAPRLAASPSTRPPTREQVVPDTRSPAVLPAPLPSPTIAATRSPPSVRPAARPAEPIADLSGRTLKGTWAVERRLASGGIGTVYVARHTRTGRAYALKTLLPDQQLSENAIARFEREARAATSIGHRGIAAVHDFDTTPEGVHYLVMDLLAGEPLELRLARVGRLPWPDARRVILEVADALAAAHRAGVLHRDLKPSNVFMATHEGAPERAMLVDFGLAKPLRPDRAHFVTRTGMIVGTAHYMAPEQARGESVDVRTDVYGLGALLYEMVAGVPPFLGSTPYAVMKMLLEEQPAAPSTHEPSLSPAVDALVLRALSRDPAGRFATVAEMIAALDAVT